MIVDLREKLRDEIVKLTEITNDPTAATLKEQRKRRNRRWDSDSALYVQDSFLTLYTTTSLHTLLQSLY